MSLQSHRGTKLSRKIKTGFQALLALTMLGIIAFSLTACGGGGSSGVGFNSRGGSSGNNVSNNNNGGRHRGDDGDDGGDDDGSDVTATTPITFGNWTWMAGSNVVNDSGVMGTLGVASSTGTPRAMQGAAVWKDTAGNLWLFGGASNIPFASYYNALWKYNTSTSQWTWMGGGGANVNGTYGALGVAAASNMPGARAYAATWTDSSGNLWLFGGYGLAATGTLAGGLNDLWKYDTTTNQWTWMGGTSTVWSAGSYGSLGVAASSNLPCGRSDGMTWTDSAGNVWLFGGYGINVIPGGGLQLNDLWEYDTTSHLWTWMGGSNANTIQTGNYGTLGVAASSNMPGGREGAAAWIDKSGKFWFFGGRGFATTMTQSRLNDLWEYDPATHLWTWMGGSNAGNASGVYNTLGVAAASSVPGARETATGWADSNGNFWLFDGVGYDSTAGFGYLNDLWKYDTTTNQWTWMGGSNTINAPGVYGTLGVASSGMPGARQFATSVTDNAGNVWLFGGRGYDSAGGFGYLNDLWKVTP